MKPLIKPAALLYFSLFLLVSANGQTLNANDLNNINNYTDEIQISDLLLEKGFKFQSKQYDNITKTTEVRYYFQTLHNSGENVTFSLIKKTDSRQVSTTLFFVHNVFHYKALIDNLKNSKYKFKGLKIVNDKSYLLFTKNKIAFLTRETKDVNDQTMYEIVVEVL